MEESGAHGSVGDARRDDPSAVNVEGSHFDVLIIGAGLSGIGAACHLVRKRPRTTFAILEARNAIGGTWDLFRYPGIRSDSATSTTKKERCRGAKMSIPSTATCNGRLILTMRSCNCPMLLLQRLFQVLLLRKMYNQVSWCKLASHYLPLLTAAYG